MADIVTPALGESVSEATVARWTKKPGDRVAKNEVLVELETDKVSLEVSAPEDGVLEQIVAPEGASVQAGQKLGSVAAGAAAKGAKTTTPASAAAPAGELQPDSAPAPKNPPAAAPVADTRAPDQRGGVAAVEIKTPAMGESVAEGAVGAWAKQAGAAVKKDEVLVEIETDKVAVEVTAPADGVLSEIVAAQGAAVKPGQVLARVTPGAAAAAAPAAQAAPAPAAAAPAAPGGPAPMPSAQRIIAENNLNPGAISGTGKDGRITKGDALAALEAGSAAPAVAAAPATPRTLGEREERVKMTRLRQTIARRLKEAQNTAAMLTTFNEADLSAVIAARKQYREIFEKKHGVKLGFMSFFVKACIVALKEIPAVNAEIDGDDIVYKNYYDIGVAVGTEQGLVVPVLRGADQMSFAEIETRLSELGRKARDGKLAIDDLTGGTFTISNGGVYGSLMSTPILNPPQSGILGMHKIEDRPIAVAGKLEIRPMMYLALSYDHRIIDGREAVTFLVRIKECIEDPQRILLDM